ncbi:bifunctional diguanylate cyclase/phosphodiesterase (plasmid) [Sphingobium sp. V4]|uniref:putative bifunctional diguanylate cyclase/phosphodiesterase n=1 Tax=Sphingobium sp. V4 TaxID=3038927 RepID=UPI00255837C1|nr:bifunctional diguanylate cyclase/phosphodiesterase [Sphingobium sp. V4]WIW90884.1 bifunctional diguanylate cyclase/phosphodiesterase [Sphingobium sp. V4]
MSISGTIKSALGRGSRSSLPPSAVMSNGFSSRQRLQHALDEMVEAREPADRLALLLIDLDRFDLVNDLCGPAKGDAVLEIVARQRLGSIRTVRSIHLAADKFACLFPFAGDEAIALALADTVQQVIREPILLGEHVVYLTASGGLVIADEPALSADDLLHAASLALSHAQQAGGETVRCFCPEMFTDLDDRTELENDLRTSLMRGEILPYYQPIILLDNSRPKGFEALARWHHPRQGLLGPDRFLPIVDDMGLDRDLLFMMLRQVCRDARDWPAHFTVSINISPAQLCDPDNAVMLLRILFASGLAPGRLIVEITESALIHNLASAHETIRSLRNTGVRIALDDFGTGYASLSRLCNLEIDHLKIDRTLIQSLDREAGRKLVKAVVDLGRSLSMPVTAEGIETPDHARFLRDLDCAFGQGYYFGRPEPADAARTRALSSHP